MAKVSTKAKTKRALEVARVLARHGFKDLVARAGITGQGESFEGIEEYKEGDAEGESSNGSSKASRLRQVFEELGTTYIKFGQILSTRPDLIPEEFVNEFKKLQSDTPKVEYDQIRARLEEAFPGRVDEIFQSIEEDPIASASIAQAHRAVLADGTRVVLKILRPGVEDIVRGDIALLEDVAKVLSGQADRLGFEPKEVIDEFSRNMEAELDFNKEGRSTERLRGYFKDTEGVDFPEVYWEATSNTVLAIEEIEGAPLSKTDLSRLPPDARRRACSLGTYSVFRMCLEIGYFHADPHPGNIFVKSNGDIAFIDCGMTGRIESKTRFQLGQLVRAVLEANLDRTIRTAIEITDANPGLELDRSFRADAWEMITRFESESIEGLDIVEMLNYFSELLRKHKIQCPSDLVYLIKALLTIEGVAEMIDPSFDIISEVKPMLKRLFKQQHGASALKKRFTNSLEGYIDLIEEFPKDLRDLVIQIRRKNYAVNLKVDNLEELRDSLANVGKLVSTALILAAMLISSSMLIHSESGVAEKGLFTKIGVVVFGLSICFILYLFVSSLRNKRRE